MRKGFTLIELLAVIVILAVIALIATPIILGIINDSKKEAFKDTAYGIIDAAKNEYISEMYKIQNPSSITFTYTNGVESSNVVGKSLNYNGSKPSNGTVTLTNTGDVAIAIHDGTNCAYKSYSDSDVTVEIKPLSECTSEYSITKGVNTPKLSEGMTPIKWDGSKWIETNIVIKNGIVMIQIIRSGLMLKQQMAQCGYGYHVIFIK